MSYGRSLNSATAGVLVAFLIGCSEPIVPPSEPFVHPSGSLAVSNLTTGAAFDPDGFSVAVQGLAPTRLELNDSSVLGGLPAGSHRVELSDIAPNCSASRGTIGSVSIEEGATTRLQFDVVCTPPPELARMRLVYTRAASEGGVHRAHIAAMNADGSDLVQLTSGAFHDQHPDVSPDGQEIVFQSDREGDPNTGSSYVYVMNADGSGQSLLTPGPAYSPDWSPDGDRVAFIGPPDHWGGPIMVLAVDDGETRALTTLDPFATVDLGAASPTWSPDGTRLAFGRGELLGWGTHTSIWVMNADGTDETRLTEPRLWGGVSPVWSPDGSRLAFTDFEGPLETGTGRIKVMNADGTATVTVLQVQGAALWAVNDWSPDGEYLLFGRSAGKGSDLYLLRLADRTTLRLTVDGRYDGGARFWPSASPSAGGTR